MVISPFPLWQLSTKGMLALLNLTLSDSVITGLDLNCMQNQSTWDEKKSKTIPTTTTETATMNEAIHNINYREHRNSLPE